MGQWRLKSWRFGWRGWRRYGWQSGMASSRTPRGCASPANGNCSSTCRGSSIFVAIVNVAATCAWACCCCHATASWSLIYNTKSNQTKPNQTISFSWSLKNLNYNIKLIFCSLVLIEHLLDRIFARFPPPTFSPKHNQQ